MDNNKFSSHEQYFEVDDRQKHREGKKIQTLGHPGPLWARSQTLTCLLLVLVSNSYSSIIINYLYHGSLALLVMNKNLE